MKGRRTIYRFKARSANGKPRAAFVNERDRRLFEAAEEMLKALKFALPNIADWSECGHGDSPRENRAYRLVLRALERAENP